MRSLVNGLRLGLFIGLTVYALQNKEYLAFFAAAIVLSNLETENKK